jgi:hypothetical protein
LAALWFVILRYVWQWRLLERFVGADGVCGSGAVVLGSGWGLLALLVVLPVLLLEQTRPTRQPAGPMLELATIVYLDILLSLTPAALPAAALRPPGGADCALAIARALRHDLAAIQTSLNSPEWHFLAGQRPRLRARRHPACPLSDPADRRPWLTVLGRRLQPVAGDLELAS